MRFRILKSAALLFTFSSLSFAEVDVVKKKAPIDMEAIDETTANDLATALGKSKGIIVKVKNENVKTMAGAELRLTSDDIAKDTNLEKAFAAGKKAAVSAEGAETIENHHWHWRGGWGWNRGAWGWGGGWNYGWNNAWYPVMGANMFAWNSFYSPGYTYFYYPRVWFCC